MSIEQITKLAGKEQRARSREDFSVELQVFTITFISRFVVEFLVIKNFDAINFAEIT